PPRRRCGARMHSLRHFSAEPAHGAIEMMEFQLVDAVDAIIVAPMLASTVGARNHEPMQHGQEHRALDRELEPAPRRAVRLKKSKPLVLALKSFLAEQLARVSG